MFVSYPGHRSVLERLVRFLDLMDESALDYVEHSHRIVTPNLGVSFQEALARVRQGLFTPMGPDQLAAADGLIDFLRLATMELAASHDPNIRKDLDMLQRAATVSLMLIAIGLDEREQ